MTTVVLAQKLMTTKLDKMEFDKIKWLRGKNTKRQQNSASCLKQLLNKQTENKTCRICLKNGYRSIFNSMDNYDLQASIVNVLGIEVYKNDGKPQYICKSCESTVRAAAILKEVAETTQWRLQQELEMLTENIEPDWDRDIDGNNQYEGHFVTSKCSVAREWHCRKCQTSFDTNELYMEHKSLPSCKTKQKYVCEICGKELTNLARLKRHKVIHSTELHLPCSYCDYRASTKYALIVHERLHTGIRPLVCNYCPARFANSANLAAHRRRHQPPRYSCEMCDKKFRFNEGIRNHMATQHSDSKAFNCEACGKAFSTQKILRRHERRVHNRPQLRARITPFSRQEPENT